MKRFSAAILCIVLVVMVTACMKTPATTDTQGNVSQGTTAAPTTASNVTAPGEFPICKEKIEIKVGIVQDPNVEDYDTNKLTKWYEEKGNFDLVFEMFPSKDAQQKLEVMIASGGELPEVLIGFTLSEEAILTYGSQGILLPLNS